MKRNSHCFFKAGVFFFQLAREIPPPVDFYGDGGKLRVRGQKFVGKGEVLPLVHGQKPADLHQIQKIVRPQIAARFQPGIQGKHGQIDAAVESLSPKCREVFRMSHIEGLSNREISKRLGITISTVENHIYNALKQLRQKLSHYKMLILLTMYILGR